MMSGEVLPEVKVSHPQTLFSYFLRFGTLDGRSGPIDTRLPPDYELYALAGKLWLLGNYSFQYLQ